MANGVNIKMGVSGIAQFKQNMNVAKNSVKTLDEALKLNEKQFKATGDAEEYMKTKSELLKKKIEEQKAIASQAEKALDAMTRNGVDKASKSFQDMQQAMLRAKGAALDAQGELDNVGSAAADVSAEVGDMNGSLQSIGKNVSISNVTDALGKITDTMGEMITKAWEVGKAITREVLGAGSWADDLNTRAAYYEIPQERLQRIEKTASLIDTSVDSILGAKQRMEKTLDAGSSDTADILTQLGLSTAIETDPEEEFWKIGEALMAMGDAYDKEGAAQKLFGKSWRELSPLFQAGREEYEKLNASWNVVPEDQVKALQEMDDQYQVLQKELETVKLTFLGELAPAAKGVMETLTGLVQKFNEYLQTENGQEMMQTLSDAISSMFEDLSNINPDDAIQVLTDIIDKIKEGLKWISENSGKVKIAVLTFIGAWATMKTAEGVTTALQLINGLRGLAGGGGTATAAAAAGKAAGTSYATSFSSAFVASAPVLAGVLGLTAAGYTGAKMIEANLKDENLNQIYGHDGEGGLIDNLTPAMTEAIAKYWDIYKNESLTGTETAFAARDTLQQLLQEAGYHNDEQGVGLIENVFENMLKGTDPDGLSAKLATAIASVGIPKIVSMVYEAQSKAQGYTSAQRAAAEEWWDTYRANPDGDNINAAYDKFQQAFEGNEDLFTKLDAMIDQYMQDNNGLNDSAWRNIEDLPSWMFANPQGSGGNSELPAALNNLGGLPGDISKAVITGMDGIRLYIDGQAAGRIIGPWMRQDMADLVLEMTQ